MQGVIDGVKLGSYNAAMLEGLCAHAGLTVDVEKPEVPVNYQAKSKTAPPAPKPTGEDLRSMMGSKCPADLAKMPIYFHHEAHVSTILSCKMEWVREN